MSVLLFDIETRSSVNLKRFGAYRYAAAEDFRILMASFSFDGGPVIDVEGQDDVLSIPGLFDDDVLKVAHNANFERVCISAAKGLRPGKYLDPNTYDCTRVLAREHGLPSSLAGLGQAVDGEKKDEAGTALINWFCKPLKDGTYRRPEDWPEKWDQFVRYCNQDVKTLADCWAYVQKLGGWPTPIERAAYVADQRINDRGIKIDIPMAEAAKAAAELNAIDQKARIREITGVANPNSVPQMMAWVTDEAIDGIYNMRKDDIEEALADPELSFEAHQREALELRLELAMASSKKFGTALECVLPDSRIHGSLDFYGAHTARWSGKGTQVQNLPSASFTTLNRQGKEVWDSVGEALTILDLLDGERVSALDIKKCVRPLFLVNGCSVDYSSIEAVVIAWLAGEEWVLQAFREGRDIYVETAERMSTPKRPLTRKEGKIAVLALGFGGGIASLRAFGAEGSDQDLRVLVTQWRRANPRIVKFWERMAEAFSEGGWAGDYIHVTHSHDKMGRTAHVRLPSGRSINYHGTKWEVFYVKDKKTGRRKRKEGWRFWDPKNPFNRNMRIPTYGGRLTENVVQATARDLLAEALVKLEARGYDAVAHIHDEILVEGTRDVGEISAIMCDLPEWAKGMPVSAEGQAMERFRK